MLVDNLIDAAIRRPRNQVPEQPTYTIADAVALLNGTTTSGETITPETAKKIATAYRCSNILLDDVAKMPFQSFRRRDSRSTERVMPDWRIRNLPYLLEIRPNRWMSPFIFQRTVMQWMVFYGNAYIWQPPSLRELFILPASRTTPVFKPDGTRFFFVTWSNGKQEYLPDVEVLHLMINSPDGFCGRSVITYAAETMGLRMGGQKTQGKFYSQGLNASGILWSSGELSPDARERARAEFERVASGSDNAYRVVVADNKFMKFEQISMQARDMQFLEGIQATDVDIANFFGLPLYKLNSGKQAYNSNEQQNLDYLNTTLDPYLVQWEQGATTSWIPLQDQGAEYCRFNRDVILRTDARTRADVLVKKVTNGLLTPNEARGIEDMSAYSGGDRHFFPQNMQAIDGGKTNDTPGK